MKRMRYCASLTAVVVTNFIAPAQAERLVRINSRPDVEQSFMLIAPDKPVATVILYAGGNGKLDLGPDGPARATNFLVRSRQLFAAEGFVVAVPDVPSDLIDRADGLDDRRASDRHTEDTRAIVTYLKRENALPVWAIGTSRGTISAANAGARLGGEIAGIVLTASVTESSRRRPETVFDADLSAIRVPVLLAHHKADRCHVTPPSGMVRIRDKLKLAPGVELFEFDGGDPPRGKACDALTAHGFLGLEQEVVSAIGRWIKSFH